jgi:DNA-binding transcriptional LysR family regulator
MLESLRIFVEVAAVGSFTAVARREDVAVSSISRKIEGLEQDLGVKLLSRRSRSVVLTDAGIAFLPRARNILGEVDEARHELADLNADPTGVLTVTAPAAFARRHIVPALPAFLAKYPRIELEMHASDQQVDLLARRVDVAIRLGVLPDSDLVATRLAPIRRLACASPDYLARHGRPRTPADLLQHNCLSYASSPMPAGWWRFSGINRDKPLTVRGTLRSDDTDTLLEAAVAGVGIVHLSSWLVYDKLVAKQLVSLFPVKEGPLSISEPALHAVRMPGRSHTLKAHVFIAHLKSHIGNSPYWDSTAMGQPGI